MVVRIDLAKLKFIIIKQNKHKAPDLNQIERSVNLQQFIKGNKVMMELAPSLPDYLKKWMLLARGYWLKSFSLRKSLLHHPNIKFRNNRILHNEQMIVAISDNVKHQQQLNRPKTVDHFCFCVFFQSPVTNNK